MTGIEVFNPVLMPGMALLILSTTMRMGNVRMALFDLSRTFAGHELCTSFGLFELRMRLLSRALQYQYGALLALLIGSFASFGSAHGIGGLEFVYIITTPLAFGGLLLAILKLHTESRSAAASVLHAAREIHELKAD